MLQAKTNPELVRFLSVAKDLKMRNGVGVAVVVVALVVVLIAVVNVSEVPCLATSDSHDSTYPCTWKDMHFDSVFRNGKRIQKALIVLTIYRVYII